MEINNKNIGSALKAGTDDAYYYVYKHFFPFMCKHAKGIVGDYNKAEDIAQKTIINLWKKKDQIKEDQNILNYLIKAVHNNSLNFIRDEDRRLKKQNEAIAPNEELDVPDYTAEQELLQKINTILDKENEERQAIFRLNRFEGLTFVEISKKLNIPLTKVQYNVAAVMEKMHEHLGNYLAILLLIAINVFINWSNVIILV